MDTSQVSRFAFLCYFGIDTLDLELYRSNLHAAVSTPGPMDSMLTFQSVSTWLHDSSASQVSHLDFWHLADLYRFGFDSSMSMLTLNSSIWMVWMLDEWS